MWTLQDAPSMGRRKAWWHEAKHVFMENGYGKLHLQKMEFVPYHATEGQEDKDTTKTG